MYMVAIISKERFRSWNHIKRYFLFEYFNPRRITTPKFTENQSSQKPKSNFVDAYNNIKILHGPYFQSEKVFMQILFIKDYWMKTKYMPVNYIILVDWNRYEKIVIIIKKYKKDVQGNFVSAFTADAQSFLKFD